MKLFITKLIQSGDEGKNLWLPGPPVSFESREEADEWCADRTFRLEILEEKAPGTRTAIIYENPS